MNWYQLEVREVFQKLKSSEEGLTDEEIKARLSEYGPNVFAREEKISKLKILLHQFTSPLIYILIIAGIYGMNFEFMPELKWHWVCPKAFWLVMLGVTGLMLVYFRRKKWL